MPEEKFNNLNNQQKADFIRSGGQVVNDEGNVTVGMPTPEQHARQQATIDSWSSPTPATTTNTETKSTQPSAPAPTPSPQSTPAPAPTPPASPAPAPPAPTSPTKPTLPTPQGIVDQILQAFQRALGRILGGGTGGGGGGRGSGGGGQAQDE